MCWDTMRQYPVTGIGPRNWGQWVKSHYGWPTAQEAHNTWMQTGAESGFPGLLALLSFYFLSTVRLWPLARGRGRPPDPGTENYARMVMASLVGFAVSSQFITLYG